MNNGTEPRYMQGVRERHAQLTARAKLGLTDQIRAALREDTGHRSLVDKFASRGEWQLRLIVLLMVPIAAVHQLPALWRGFVAGWRAGGNNPRSHRDRSRPRAKTKPPR
jgi:hypothetical protein